MLLPTGPDGLRRFTRESLAALEQRIAEEQAKGSKDCTEAQKNAETTKPRPDLEAGKQLPRIFGDIPADLVGVPLEDIDPFYYKNQKMADREIESILQRTVIPACYFIMFTILTNCFFMAMSDPPTWTKYLDDFCRITKNVHLHWYLHFRVGNKDFCERILFSAVHLPERPMELAGLHRHCHGVSLKTIVGALIQSVRKLADVMILTVFCLSVFALIGLQLFMGLLRQKCVRSLDHCINSSYSPNTTFICHNRTWSSPADFLSNEGQP
ncbi:hypothetical protein GOODEAATRI_011389 [Goodea atripinnis]|uniref:Ion transport domain-containing protein n=1 Tax=Goodea atripinnis TaxID=208336 RepID=A0ABV0MR86_9TELE